MRFSLLLPFLLTLPLSSPAQSWQSPDDLVRSVIANELKAENADHSHWMYRLDTRKPKGPQEVDEVVEATDGDLHRPILINGHRLSLQQEKRADAHIQCLVQHPNSLRKSHSDQTPDENQSQHMLKLLPDAFVFQYGERRGDLVQLNFKPNPAIPPARS
jgi:hypothetical protein